MGIANAQSGEITGTVTDPTGAIVANAHVTITSIETGNTHTTVSNGAGVFDFPSLNVGDYNLAVGASGFETYKKNGIVMNVAADAEGRRHPGRRWQQPDRHRPGRRAADAVRDQRDQHPDHRAADGLSWPPTAAT